MERVIVEIRPAEGGDDAKLFTLDLYKVLVSYCKSKKWTTDLMWMKSIGKGFQEIVFSVEGKGVYDRLKREAGGHRVQRVPPTEKRGRRQTSTVTVAVLPEPSEIDLRIDPKDLKWETMRSTGNGGQSVNTTDSAVRVTHTPTGVSAIAQEKSQHANRKRVLSVLRSRLLEQKEIQQHQKRNTKRAKQLGTGQRGDKVRTIRYQDGRVTDHRTGKKVRIKSWESGELDKLL